MVKYFIVYLLLTIMLSSLTFQQQSVFPTLVSYPCYTDEDCINEFSQNATCQNDNCVCGSESTICIRYVRNIIGESCDFNVNCDIINSHCQNNRCECNDGHIVSGQKRNCLKVAQSLNESCEINAQCVEIPLSVCSSKNACVCKIFHYEKDGKCYRKAGLNKFCEDSNNCLHIPNTKCDNNRCVCDTGYVDNELQTECLKMISRTSETCEHRNQCRKLMGVHAICSNSTCVCDDMSHYDEISMKCEKNIGLGGPCNRDIDCYQEEAGELECILNVCKCISPFIEHRNQCIIASHAVTTVITGSLLFSLLLIIFFF
ncbi:prion-like-(Q/N-rich) domain-bearing protein 25 [Chrysoperla carnea]|uniref:prion-like-(Q/N-rich) domain-bearing protein 25 n=1 Tax=Chrysoperla carnea TaxID=189513 RepID=UPI001D094567|nr:prion-like-(Q/N-rich) domain-bearing protein 25 [Chrysoperla carnea]